MNTSILILSFLPILTLLIGKAFNFNRYLNYAVPILIYLIILATLFKVTPSEISNTFLTVKNNQIDLLFNFSNSYTLMSKVVLLISILVLLYSSKFMHNESERSHSRYFLYLIVFITSMFLFTLSNDLFSSFIFWEVLGLSSYFLIGFWNKDSEAIKSSTIAFWITRFGDLFFLGGIVLIFSLTGTLSIEKINSLTSSSLISLEIPFILIIIGIFSKSAQFPFNIWLPKAMKGPTPVSSLIHSATMVVAGVLLLYKIHPAISSSGLSLNLIAIIGIISSVLGAIAAFFEDDLKKILAFSTISHIGLMFLAIGISKPDLAYFHMFSHSFFKSLLFLYAGVIILINGTSSLEKLKGSINIKSTAGIVLLIACCSLSSVYFFTGSYSKEFIVFSLINQKHFILSSLMLIGIIFTCLYSARIFFTLINFNTKGLKEVKINARFLIPLAILSVFSLLGFFTMGLFQTDITIIKVPHNLQSILLLQLLTFLIFFLYFRYKDSLLVRLKQFNSVSNAFFKTDFIYLEIYEKVFKSSSIFIAWFDRNIIDGIINLLPFKILQISRDLMSLQDGYAKSYALRTIIFFILFILVMSIVDSSLIIGELK